MARFDLVLLDYNGTILDDAPLANKCANTILQYYDRPPATLEEYRNEITAENYTQFYYDRGVPKTTTNDELLSMWRKFFKNYWSPDLLRPGVRKFIHHCIVRKINLALITAEPYDIVLNQLDALVLTPYFKRLWCGVHDKGRSIKDVCVLFNTKPHETLFVDDMPWCLEAAKKCGVFTVGMKGGGATDERIEKVKPDAIISSFDELCALLKGEKEEHPL